MMLFLRQFRAELLKMFARKRTWMGFASFMVLEILILSGFRLNGVQSVLQRNFQREAAGLGLVFADYFRGLTMAFTVMGATVFLLGCLFLALVGGDVVSKEAEDGTLRMTLCRPVSRFRLLMVKYLSCVVYTFVLVAFIGVSALITGAIWRGIGGLFAFVPEERLVVLYSQSEGLARYAASIPLHSLSVLTITTMAFMFSCFNVKPAAATVVTLAVFIADWILRMMPQFESYRHWFMTTHMATWANIFRDPIPWDRIAGDYLYLFGLNATFLIIGLAVFSRRDFKS